MTSKTTEGDPQGLANLLAQADLTVEGQLSGASNATLLCWVDDRRNDDPLSDEPIRCVYKPKRGERPLWDFPTGTLGRREVATYLLAESIGWGSIPVTVWREDGPFGPGMCQAWIDADSARPAVDVVTPSEVPEGWRVVLEAQTYDGQDVVLAHEDSEELQRIAVLDIITNNADRKGGHVLRSPLGNPQGIDHGLAFHVEPKLRTVLWGWAREPLDPAILRDLEALMSILEDRPQHSTEFGHYISKSEYSALLGRITHLLDTGKFPDPGPEHPALPWPPM